MQKSTERQAPEVPSWTLPFDELAQIFSLAAPRLVRFPYPAFDLVFSCSNFGIWPTTSLGFIHPPDRILVDGKSSVLDTLAVLLMAQCESHTGGRFTVTPNHAFRTKDRLLLASFELSA